ncbi:tandem-95 repeat protein [Cytophagaceae bacterium AH-315-L13]|nr:tandem-95 repeat protein [Cytophagaceae bacterium AH-315-L13]
MYIRLWFVNNSELDVTSANFGFQLDNLPIVTQYWSGNVAAHDSMLFSFAVPAEFDSTNLSISIWTANPSGVPDGIPTNDTVKIVFPCNTGNDSIFPPKPFFEAIYDTTSENTSLIIDAQGNFFDPEGGNMYTSILSGPANGTASVLNTDSISYTPTSGFVGQDVIKYLVCDDDNLCDSASIIIEVLNVNEAPFAMYDTLYIQTLSNTQVNVDLLTHFDDPDGDALTTSISTNPSNGTVTISNNNLNYMPVTNYSGLDHVVVSACDPDGLCTDLVVEIEVLPPGNYAPVAIQDTIFAATDANTSITVDVQAYFNDPNSDPLSTTIITGAVNGVSSAANNDSIYYLPNSGYLGNDIIVFSVCDTGGLCDTAVLVIDVSGCPAPLSVSVTATNVGCIGGTNGTADVTVLNGTTPYSYQWSNGETTPILLGLTPGNYLVTVSDANGCNGNSTATIGTDSVSCGDVWPGDANNNGVCNNFDLFKIGLSMKHTGPPRDSVDINWFGHYADEWPFDSEAGVNEKYVDCNGDGKISGKDAVAITTNFGLTHSKAPSSKFNNPANPDLYFEILSGDIAPGTTVEVAIILGRDTVSLYGIAFDIQLDLGLIENASLKINYDNSWLAVQDTGFLTLVHTDFSSGIVYGACVRTDQDSALNYGEIARLQFVVDSSITDTIDLNLELINSGGVMVNGDSTVFYHSEESDTSVTINPGTGIGNSLINVTDFNIYPNPYTNETSITYTLTKRTKVKLNIFDILGNHIYTVIDEEMGNGACHYSFSAKRQGHTSGVYMLKGNIGNQQVSEILIELH